MKTILSQHLKSSSFLPILALASSLSLGINDAVAHELSHLNSCQNPQRDSIVVTKTQVSKKYKIRIYPNATHEVLFFSANGEEGKLYELFVFNMNGKLIKRIQVHNRETTLLKTFEKGSYIFEVFSNDERIENGSMTVN